ncbi:FabD/lysophospholipase-like protein [Lindgomyces ingoldianus]|uniref:FabD/lysophospholipase-like protein n=1 Tax=Lindgomyces ingoldianus TaxID=673940 RepID=A0ACB6QFS1_9PLEO|nr:FabD/lysophospholipase-like protein [Lindgomyces ingoldianus]KAF2465829.1 FabD/lysophospholipase-like protein [Lindgomyces ingoldianus]
MDPPLSPGERCEDERCDRKSDDYIWYCVDCSCRFCESCWRFQPPHRKGKYARDGKPHEQIDYHIAKRLESILNPSNDREEVRKLHETDEKSTWFGWAKDDNQCPVLEDFGAYVSLMAESTRDSVLPKYPQIVSFVGETSKYHDSHSKERAGKSTIINMLIKLHDPWREGGDEWSIPFPAPVCGSPADHNKPTSADVHLYADPKTFYSDKPILLADCEGLNGGEEVPIAKRKKLGREALELMKLARERTRDHLEISWADPKGNDPQRRTREFAVSELYPRILYTFSDAVVFVSRNAKTFQSGALKKLLEWGQRSLEKSTNQPALPRAIVALNATEIGVDESEWDIDKATASLLSSVKNALHPQHGVPSFQALARFWEQKGIRITSVYDLIRCYYGSFHVVTIPRGGRYSIMQSQVQALHNRIVECCNDSRQDREKARLRFTSEALQVYLQEAFKHFRRTIDEPFDFKKVSFQVHPIPANFGGRIFELAEAVYASYRSLSKRPTTIEVFTEMSSMIASCVLLDVHRNRKGEDSDPLEYEKHFSFALEEFCGSAMPCSFRSKHGELCVNVSSRHSSKGHQNSKGKIIGSGKYESSGFNHKDFSKRFMRLIKRRLCKLESELQVSTGPDAEGGTSGNAQVLQLHERTMAEFYKKFESRQRIVSHQACLSCLMSPPDYVLPCAHGLCSDCAYSFGTREDDTTLTLTCCPLHQGEGAWPRLWRIRLKPEFAGVRILSLDGGGVRGIVELEVLRLLQKQLGDRLPIQNFFDIIVGTSTGSIIALALGVLGLSVDDCTTKFSELCRTAFTKRKTYMTLRSKFSAVLFRGSIYRTRPLYDSLRQSLGDARIFGGAGKKSHFYDIKVAVTSTDELAKNAIIMANYNRQGENYARHIFQRPSDPNKELMIWEAAAASAAAPPYFTAFWHPETSREYLDGAFHNNNPVRVAYREAQLLWPEVSKLPPDVLLSIGTGKEGDTDGRADDRLEIEYDLQLLSERFQRQKNHLSTSIHIIDAEVAWKLFLRERAVSADAQSRTSARYIRLNPEMDVVPELDAAEDLSKLLSVTSKGISEETLRDVALHLVASTFYFKKLGCSARNTDSGYDCHGK